MANPLQTAKPTVDLDSLEPRASRIRRDPPQRTAKKTVVPDRDERDQWVVTVGVLAFALAIFAITIAFGSYSAWSPREYRIELNASE